MTILEKLKEKREAIKAVEGAKKRKKKPEIENELTEEADKLVNDLDVTFDEAMIYVKNEKNREQRNKIAQERQTRIAAKSKKILRGLEDWSARANKPLAGTTTENTKPDLQQETGKKTKVENKIKKAPPIPRKQKKPKTFFEMCEGHRPRSKERGMR